MEKELGEFQTRIAETKEKRSSEMEVERILRGSSRENAQPDQTIKGLHQRPKRRVIQLDKTEQENRGFKNPSIQSQPLSGPRHDPLKGEQEHGRQSADRILYRTRSRRTVAGIRNAGS
jgi:hypothetical protein